LFIWREVRGAGIRLRGAEEETTSEWNTDEERRVAKEKKEAEERADL